MLYPFLIYMEGQVAGMQLIDYLHSGFCQPAGKAGTGWSVMLPLPRETFYSISCRSNTADVGFWLSSPSSIFRLRPESRVQKKREKLSPENPGRAPQHGDLKIEKANEEQKSGVW
jgi:hypothetical protein